MQIYLICISFSVRLMVRCPYCGFRFDIMYSRVRSCSGCIILAKNLSCKYIKCPNCGHEFSTD